MLQQSFRPLDSLSPCLVRNTFLPPHARLARDKLHVRLHTRQQLQQSLRGAFTAFPMSLCGTLTCRPELTLPASNCTFACTPLTTTAQPQNLRQPLLSCRPLPPEAAHLPAHPPPPATTPQRGPTLPLCGTLPCRPERTLLYLAGRVSGGNAHAPCTFRLIVTRPVCQLQPVTLISSRQRPLQQVHGQVLPLSIPHPGQKQAQRIV